MEEYLARHLVHQKVKAEHQHPAGLLQPLPIPKWKWETISMDFIIGLPKNFRHHDSSMVVVKKLRLLIFMKEIFRLHGVPKVIVSDRDATFTSNF